jgi:hypothetical protein
VTPRMKVEDVARLVHESNRIVCVATSTGHDRRPHWDDAPQEQRDSCIDGVRKILSGAVKSVRENHENWRRLKGDQGWSWAPKRNEEKKESPCICDYDQLPIAEKVKSENLQIIVEFARPFLADGD